MGFDIEFNENEFTKGLVPLEEIAELKKEIDKLKEEYSSDENSWAKISVVSNKLRTFRISVGRHGKESEKTLNAKLPPHPLAKQIAQAIRGSLEELS